GPSAPRRVHHATACCTTRRPHVSCAPPWNPRLERDGGAAALQGARAFGNRAVLGGVPAHGLRADSRLTPPPTHLPAPRAPGDDRPARQEAARLGPCRDDRSLSPLRGQRRTIDGALKLDLTPFPFPHCPVLRRRPAASRALSNGFQNKNIFSFPDREAASYALSRLLALDFRGRKLRVEFARPNNHALRAANTTSSAAKNLAYVHFDVHVDLSANPPPPPQQQQQQRRHIPARQPSFQVGDKQAGHSNPKQTTTTTYPAQAAAGASHQRANPVPIAPRVGWVPAFVRGILFYDQPGNAET
ncbi:MAG: hypothetical protein BJ554DRAFT_1295, partial [Olpidium bornovanus]